MGNFVAFDSFLSGSEEICEEEKLTRLHKGQLSNSKA
jgi:hypothetical protein